MNIQEFKEILPHENTIVVMIGASGSGKSTLARAIIESDDQRVSSDDLRQVLMGDPTCQEENGLVFYMMAKIITCRGKHGAFTVADATHLKRKFRRQVVSQYAEDASEVHAVAVLVDTGEETCLSRQASRERQVPEHVVKRHCGQYEHSKQNVKEEDFFNAVFIYDGEEVHPYDAE